MLLITASMLPGMGLAILAMACFGAGDFVYKRAAAAGIEARHFVMLQAWFFCPAVTLYAMARHQLVLEAPALWGSLTGVLMLVALYNFARSLRAGSISTHAPIFRLSFVLTAALAIVVLGEPPNPGKLAGLSLAAVAVWTILGDAPAGPAPHHGSLGAVIVATVAAGVANLLYKVGLGAGAPPATLLATQAWTFCSLATLFVWWSDGRIAPPPDGLRFGALIGATLLVGFVALLNALAVGPASVLVPVAQLGFVFTAPLGRLLLAEPLSSRTRWGLVAATAAVATLASG